MMVDFCGCDLRYVVEIWNSDRVNTGKKPLITRKIINVVNPRAIVLFVSISMLHTVALVPIKRRANNKHALSARSTVGKRARIIHLPLRDVRVPVRKRTVQNNTISTSHQ